MLVVSHAVVEGDDNVDVAPSRPETVHAAASSADCDLAVEEVKVGLLTLFVESSLDPLDDQIPRFQLFLSHQLLLVDLFNKCFSPCQGFGPKRGVEAI